MPAQRGVLWSKHQPSGQHLTGEGSGGGQANDSAMSPWLYTYRAGSLPIRVLSCAFTGEPAPHLSTDVRLFCFNKFTKTQSSCPVHILLCGFQITYKTLHQSCCSVAKSRLTLHDSVDCGTPGSLVLCSQNLFKLASIEMLLILNHLIL